MVIPVISLLVLATVIVSVLLRRRGVRLAYIWLMITTVVFFTWLFLLFANYSGFKPLIIPGWFQIENYSVTLKFDLNAGNWALIFSIFVILLSYLLTSIARIKIKTDLRYWSWAICFSISTFLIFTSTSLWTIILTWTIFDFLYLVFRLEGVKGYQFNHFFSEYIFKYFGSIILFSLIALNSGSAMDISLNELSNRTFLPIFFASFFHSGLLPLGNNEDSILKGDSFEIIKIFIRLLNYVSSFFILIYLPDIVIPLLPNILIILLSYLFMILFAYLWMVNQNSISTLKYLLFCITGIILNLLITSNTHLIIYWLIFLLLPLMWLYLYSHRSNHLIIFPAMIFLSFSGLPLTLLAFGIRTIPVSFFSFHTIFYFISHILVSAGFLIKGISDNRKFENLDSWYQVIFLVGLFLPVFSISLVIFTFLGAMVDEIAFWWAGFIAALFSIMIVIIRKQNIIKILSINGNQNLLIQEILSFNWFFHTLKFIGNQMQSLVNGFSALLEGEGGVIWSIVILVLFISLLRLS